MPFNKHRWSVMWPLRHRTERTPQASPAVLPPEASTNWLFDENVLFHFLTTRCLLYMDRADYYRYKRLGTHADLDFLKYFLLTLLERLGVLIFLDYSQICSEQSIITSLDGIRARNLLRYTKRHADVVRSGYYKYLDYISKKERVLTLFGGTTDHDSFDREQAAAKKHIREMELGAFDDYERNCYLRRLATKLMTAQTVCEKVGGVIFDSREYQRGVTLLKNEGLLPPSSVFYAEPFKRAPGFDRLLGFCEKEGYLRQTRDDAKRMDVLRFWLPYSLLENLGIRGQTLVPIISRQLAATSEQQLKAEVEEWFHSHHHSLGGLERHKHWITAATNAMGFVPFVGNIVGGVLAIRELLSVRQSARTSFTTVAELIGIALMTEAGPANLDLRKRISNLWIRWFYNHFGRRHATQDEKWSSSQREMGAWTRTDLYVPWYEHSDERLKSLRLV